MNNHTSEGRTSRVNISVPADLKARMAAEDGVNWSRIAAAAFERELDDRDVARRLAGDDAEQQRGRAAGEQWAREHASRHQLHRALAMVSSTDWGRFDGDSLSFDLLRSIDEHAFMTMKDAAEFWDQWADTTDPAPEFVTAFFEAAADVFERVGGLL